MEALGVVGFVFGLCGAAFGIMAWMRINSLVSTLQDKGLLDESDVTE